MDKASYDAITAQSDWHEAALRALLERDARRAQRRPSIQAAYFGILSAVFSFGLVAGWSGKPGGWEAAAFFTGGLALGSLIEVFARRWLGSSTAWFVAAEFGTAVRIYLARKLQGAVHGTGVEGNLAEAERDRRRLGLPDIPMGEPHP
jgi:hypothetical protein